MLCDRTLSQFSLCCNSHLKQTMAIVGFVFILRSPNELSSSLGKVFGAYCTCHRDQLKLRTAVILSFNKSPKNTIILCCCREGNEVKKGGRKVKRRKELLGQYLLPMVTNESPLSWTVFLGCSTCPPRHASGQGDLFSP